MPLPVPRPDETRNDFITRCMNDVDNTNEFPDREQRLAVCESQAENADRKSLGIKYIRQALK